MTTKRIEGLRTLIGFLVAVVALTGGLSLLAVDQRLKAYGAFSAGIVGVFLSLAGKSSVGALAGGGGAKGAWAALTTSATPEGTEPPAPPAPPPGVTP